MIRDPVYGIITKQQGETLVEFSNGKYTVPEHIEDFRPSYYDYFSYKLGICGTPESLLLAATDCMYPFTLMAKSLADRSYLEISYLPTSEDDIRQIFVNNNKCLEYVHNREPNSILYGTTNQKLNNYIVRETIDDLKSMLDSGESSLDLAVLENPKTKDLSIIDVMKENSMLVCLVKELDPEKLLKIVNEFRKVNLFVFKMCSPLVVIRAEGKESSNNDIKIVTEFISVFRSYVNSLVVPDTPVPQHIYRTMLNI